MIMIRLKAISRNGVPLRCEVNSTSSQNLMTLSSICIDSDIEIMTIDIERASEQMNEFANPLCNFHIL